MAKKAGFTVVDEENEVDFAEKMAEHKKHKIRRVVWVLLILAAIVGFAELWIQLCNYTKYDVRNTVETGEKSASKFTSFAGAVLEYSNDGAVYEKGDGTLLWNQSFEMTNPSISICQEYLAIYDRDGTEIFIMKKDGLIKQIETAMPIRTVSVALQGTIAVLMEKGSNYYVKLYNSGGEELAGGEYFVDNGSIPVDIALSADGKKLAVDMVNVSAGKVDTTISFYNFGSVGQSEIDNSVGSYTYKDTFVPEIEYIAGDRMVALGDNSVLIFTGSQKPELDTEIKLQNQISSFFYNDKYIGLCYANVYSEEEKEADEKKEDEELKANHIVIYDVKGSVVAEFDSDIIYKDIEFLDNNEICILSDYECEIFTVHSIKKFTYSFENVVYDILHEDGISDYIFISEGKMEEVRLK